MPGHVTALPNPPPVGALVRHVDTGIVGIVEKSFAPGEHPNVSCAVLALSTGDELIWKPEAFEEIGGETVALFYRELVVPMMRSGAKLMHASAAKLGVDAKLLPALLRGALSEALRPSVKPQPPSPSS